MIVVTELVILVANLIVLGMTIKVYTEFIKEKKYRQ